MDYFDAVLYYTMSATVAVWVHMLADVPYPEGKPLRLIPLTFLPYAIYYALVGQHKENK